MVMDGGLSSEIYNSQYKMIHQYLSIPEGKSIAMHWPRFLFW